uniref:Uncharacterized protein n=1 Tax=Branchiostoma floridae TaxID=7739 RepID=C3ZTU3_BRAFL|eukprot:XP_002588080.1 hypothetical protein BRAFLDRAFT_83081 [Branchiostoma floridae]
MTLSVTKPMVNDSCSSASDDGEEGEGLTDLSPVGVATTTMPVEYILLPPHQPAQYHRMLDFTYTVMIAVSVSLMVGLTVGWLIRNKAPLKQRDGPAMTDRSSFPPSHRSSLSYLHHYEVIPDDIFPPLRPYAQVFLNPQYGQGNMKLRPSKRSDVFLNPQYGQGNVKQGSSKHTEVFVNPQYGRGKGKINHKRRWSTPVLLPSVTPA